MGTDAFFSGRRLVAMAAALGGTGAAAIVACSSPDASENDGDLTAHGMVDVQLLALNDFHGNLGPPTGSGGLVTLPASDPAVGASIDAGTPVVTTDAGTAQVPAGGAAWLATRVKRLRQGQPNTIVVSAGDLVGASPLVSNLFRDEPAILAMNELGLDFAGVGNHEFDRGLDELLRLSRGGCSLGDCDAGRPFAGAKFQFLAANVTSERPSISRTIFPPYALKEIGGVKIGFIGLTLEATPSVTVAQAVSGLSFANEATTVNALVPRLRSEGASAVVVLIHQGGRQAPTGTVDTCESLTGDILPVVQGFEPGVDVVVSAHTHQPYNCRLPGSDILLTSAASAGRVLTKIDLVVDPRGRRVVSKTAKNIPNTRDVPPDPEVQSLLAKVETEAAPLANRVVGRITANLPGNPQTAGIPSCETPLGDVIADAQLRATRGPNDGAAVIAFMNPGGIRTDLVHAASASEGDGIVTYGEAFAVQPFANNLVTLTLSGAQIRTLLNQQFGTVMPRILQVSSGFAYRYHWEPATQTGTVDPASVTLDGAPIDDARRYRVTVNGFLAGGGDGFAVLREGTEALSGPIDLDALVAYLSENQPLAVPATTRIIGDGCPR